VRQLILDAQAMMDPDFAGKLAADVAESRANAADTDFSFGAEAPSEEPIPVTDESQLPLLDLANLQSDAADAPERPFLVMPSQDTNEIAEASERQEVSGHEFTRAVNGEKREGALAPEGVAGSNTDLQNAEARSAFRSPGDSATLPELIRFLIDRTGYIKALETEGTPEAFSRIENLKELANAAHDAEERGETLADFLDHAALASDTDQYDPNARVTLMTLHAAKGLEFPLVFLAGLEEGLFPHSRTLNSPEELEEERRLCYVGMTRAMNTLILTRTHYRRRYGNDVPELSIPSRFLEEVPSQLIEVLGGGRPAWSTPAYAPGYGTGRTRPLGESDSRHFNYEDESQEAPRANVSDFSSRQSSAPKAKGSESIENIARFFGGKSGVYSKGGVPPVSMPGPPARGPGRWGGLRPGRDVRTPMNLPTPNGAFGLRKGQRVMHAKYGEGTVLLREGEGEDAKLTVLFARHGMKKLMEKFANLKRI
jgi:DNA helicase II / ATP-dependent DNA helicase PcrA